MDRHFKTLNIRFYFIPLTVLRCLQIVAFFHKNLVARTTLFPLLLTYLFELYQTLFERSFPLIGFPLILSPPDSNTRYRIAFGCHVSVVFSRLHVSFCPCPLWHWRLFKKLFNRMPLNFCLIFSHGQVEVRHLWQRHHIGDVLCSPVYAICGYAMSTYLMTGCIQLDHLV